MALNIYQRRKLQITLYLITVGVVAGPFYVLFSDGFGSLFPYINAFTAGTLLALLVAWVELFLLEGQRRFWKFYHILLVRISLYSIAAPVIPFMVFLLSRALKYDMSLKAVLVSDEFQNFLVSKDFSLAIIYSLIIVLTASFTHQMSRKMGQGLLLNFISGRFYHPKYDYKIIMFLKIRKSTKIIKRIGRLNFHKFLKDITYHIAPSIQAHRGLVHHYVEDEMVIYWNKKRGFDQANAVRLCESIVNCFEGLKESYFEKYGVIPLFRMAIHAGEVAQGEIGEVKSEIAFYGDVMNTTSRILMKCKELAQPVLISNEVRQQTNLPEIYEWLDCGSLPLRGKKDNAQLYSIREVQLPGI